MFTLRDYCATDAVQVDAFEQYRAAYADWPAFRRIEYVVRNLRQALT